MKPGGQGAREFWERITPAVGWLRSYQGAWFREDLLAGITLAAYMLPAGLGDASLAGLPPEAGLYSCLFSGLIFWLFCSSRHTAITVTSAISLLIGSSLGPLAAGDTARFSALAACTALIVAGLALLAWLARAGVVVNFISETVLVGFKTGIALVLASTQLPKLFGIKSAHGDFWENMGYFLAHLGDTHTLSLALGLGALGILVLGKIWFRNRPVALVVVIGGVLAASWGKLDQQGVALLGTLPQGLPPFGLPSVHWTDLNELLPLAMACFLLGAVETTAIGRMWAVKHGYRLDSNQEFLALAGANLAAGLGQGYPVSGGMSQSLVNEAGGARTTLSGLISALIILVITIFFSDLLHNLPKPVLAAIVLMAVTGLFKLNALQRLWKFSRTEFAVAAAALAGVLGSGILRGVLIGAILSIVVLLRRASKPPVAVLGRVPGTDLYGDIQRNPENERTAGVLVFRVDSAILFFNAEYVREQFLEALKAQTPPVRLAVWCLATTPAVDLAGAEMLEHLQVDLANQGIALKLAEARGPLRETLRAAGLEEHFGVLKENTAIAPLIRAWQSRNPVEQGTPP